MTKSEAIENCLNLWHWISRNPSRDKNDWRGWKKNNGNVENCLFDCPACQYVMENTPLWLKGIPPLDCENFCFVYSFLKCHCREETSIYAKWESAEDEFAKKLFAVSMYKMFIDIFEEDKKLQMKLEADKRHNIAVANLYD